MTIPFIPPEGLRQRGRAGQMGFTLFELLVVLLIMSLSVTLIAPNLFNTVAGVEEKITLNNLAADISGMGMRAFLQDEPLQVEFQDERMTVRRPYSNEVVLERDYPPVVFETRALQISRTGQVTPETLSVALGEERYSIPVGKGTVRRR